MSIKKISNIQPESFEFSKDNLLEAEKAEAAATKEVVKSRYDSCQEETSCQGGTG